MKKLSKIIIILITILFIIISIINIIMISYSSNYIDKDVNYDEISYVLVLGAGIRNNYPSLKIGWYSGQEAINKAVLESISNFDYIKVGSYIEEFGPLNKQTTNQTMYKVLYDKEGEYKMLEDITYKFWKKQ